MPYHKSEPIKPDTFEGITLKDRLKETYYVAKKKKKKKKVEKKVVKKEKKTMTQKQKDKLKEHSKKHSAKHMSAMKKMMKGGASFTKAHNAAKKITGK